MKFTKGKYTRPVVWLAITTFAVAMAVSTVVETRMQDRAAEQTIAEYWDTEARQVAELRLWKTREVPVSNAGSTTVDTYWRDFGAEAAGYSIQEYEAAIEAVSDRPGYYMVPVSPK